MRAVWRWQRREARRLGVTAGLQGGGLNFTQWFGSSLQLTPHLHLLVPEAMWKPDGEAVLLPAPSDVDVMAVLTRVLRQVKKDFADAEAPWPEDEYEAGQKASMQRPLSLDMPVSRKWRPRVAVAQGFSLHADTAVHGNDRQGLERLVRYGARGPLAESRLKRLEDGRYEYTPKKKAAFTLTAEALVRRLVSMVPPPKIHLLNFHGAYASHAALRPLVFRPPHHRRQGRCIVSRRIGRPRSPAALVWTGLPSTNTPGPLMSKRYPCGGQRHVKAVYGTPNAAQARLTELGHPLPSRLLPPSTAQPCLPLAPA